MVERVYVAETKWRQEDVAERRLKDQGYSVVKPTMVADRMVRRQRVQKCLLLFPRYLFVLLDLSAERWQPIQNTPGMARMYGCVDAAGIWRPVPLPEAEATRLVQQALAGPIREADFFALWPGRRVRVVRGPFADSTGRVGPRLTAEGRVAVLLGLFGREQEIEIPRDWVETEFT